MPERNEEMNRLIEALQATEAEKIVLQHELDKVHTNYRGQYPDAQRGQMCDIDGNDGWPYHAWSGATIAYGCSEAHAEANLREKIKDSTYPDIRS